MNDVEAAATKSAELSNLDVVLEEVVATEHETKKPVENTAELVGTDTAEPAESTLESAGEEAATEDQSSATRSYTAKIMLSLRSKFVEIPEGADTTLQCFGVGSSQMDQGRSSASGFRDRGSSRPEFQLPRFAGAVAPLAFTDNRYVIKKEMEGEKKVLRSIQSILNKLMPETFDVLTQRLIALILESVEYLEDIVSLIFNQALMEYNFASMYADLCTTLYTSPAAAGMASKFRMLILQNSQEEFESRVELSSFDSLPVRLCLTSWQEEAKYRRRAKAFFTFLGRLFVNKLIHSGIISICVLGLMGNVTRLQEDGIEQLVALLTVTGKLFEIKSPKLVSAVFSHLMNMVLEKKLSSRPRFDIKGLIELRHRNWQPRTEAVVGTTDAEVLAKEAAAQDARARDRHRSLRRRDRDRRRPARPPPTAGRLHATQSVV